MCKKLILLTLCAFALSTMVAVRVVADACTRRGEFEVPE